MQTHASDNNDSSTVLHHVKAGALHCIHMPKQTVKHQHKENAKYVDESEKHCLRRQSVLELHAGHVVIQSHGQHLFHGADEAILLTAVLDH